MKKSLLTVAVSVVLAAAMLVGAPVAMAAEGDDWLNLDNPNSLTVNLPSAYQEEFAKCVDGLGKAVTDAKHTLGVQVDLYLIAEAVKIDGQDAYTFTDFKVANDQLKAVYGDGFTDETEAAAGWQQMSVIAAKAVLGGVDAPALDTDGNSGVIGATCSLTLDKLPAGLYLLVAHEPNAEPHDRDDGDQKTLGYYREVPAPAAEGAQSEEKVVETMAYSPLYEYAFTPSLVAVPTRGQVQVDGEEGFTGGGTANDAGENWMYELSALVKGERQPRYGSLKIVKTLEEMVGTEPAAFSFDINVVTPDGKSYTDNRSVVFNAPGNPQEIVVNRIPVGSTVTVSEKYAGASYTVAAAGSTGDTIGVADVIEFDFTNRPTDLHRGGSGIVNTLKMEGDGWVWYKNGEPGETTPTE